MTEIITTHLELPATTADLRKLAIGTVVYLTGRVFTARERVYQHAIEDGAGMPASKEVLGAVNFHCSPAAAVNDDGTYTVGAVTATASFRFNKWLDGWFRISGCNIIIGKGGMNRKFIGRTSCPTTRSTSPRSATAPALSWVAASSASITSTGLEELGLAQAVWVLDVEKFGPFIVESDLDGNSLFERENAKIAAGIEKLYEGTRPATMRRFGEDR